jgi:hypothetical protein
MGFFFTLFLYAALFIAAELLRPKPDLENAKPAGLGDFQFPTATEGRPVPLVWGTEQIKGPNVIWYGDFVQDPITEEVKVNLFQSETLIKGFKYNIGIQFALARGGVGAELLRVWIGDEEVFNGTVTHDTTFTINEPELFGGDELGQGGVVGTLRFFEGNQTQSPSSYLGSRAVTNVAEDNGGSSYSVNDVLTLVGGTGTAAQVRVTSVNSGVVDGVILQNAGNYTAFPSSPAATTGGGGTGCTISFDQAAGFQTVGANNRVPGYRGTMYICPDDAPTYIGNSTSIKPWKFEVRRIPNGLGLSTAQAELNSGNDCNPMNVIYEILTDSEWGLGIDAGDIDTTNFSTAAATLATEGNGFSFLLDNKTEATQLLSLLTDQIDGVLFFNQLTGQWQVTLARADYVVASLDPLDETNSQVTSFGRGSWEDTTNIVQAQFFDRSDEFKQTYAVAYDLANIRVQNGTNIVAVQNWPGVRNRTLANTLAWRSLRGLSYPTARATVVGDRSFYDVQPGQVLRFSDDDLGLTDLPMRITRVDLGLLEQGQVKMDLVQDIYQFANSPFSDAPDSSWTAPADTLLPFPPAEQLAFEAPRGFILRDPKNTGGVISNKIWAGARRQGPEASFFISERHSAGTPTGSYADVGEVFGFMLIGQLTSALNTKSAYPLTSLTITPSPDSQSDLLALFGTPTSEDLGQNLTQLILVDNEFMLVSSASTNASNIDLDNVYRGVLDSTQEDHSASANVYMVFIGGGISDGVLPATDNVEVALRPRSRTDEISSADVEANNSTIEFTMNRRPDRPYPPASIDLNGTYFDATSVSLEGIGSAAEDYGIEVDLIRRDFRTGDEVASLSTDAATLDPTYPTANNTTHEIEVWDTSGSPALLFTTAAFSGLTTTVGRLEILQATDGVIPTDLRFFVRSTHDAGGQTGLDSYYDLQHDFTVATALTGQFEFGALDNGDDSNSYTADAAGTHSFTLSSAFTAGDVEYRIDTGGGFGAWTTLIAAGGTGPGNIAGVSIGDIIQVQHLSSDSNALKQLDMTAPGAGTDAFAILFT